MSEGFHNSTGAHFCTTVACEYEKQAEERRGEGTDTCPAQQADVLWGSLGVAARKKMTDCCRTYTCFARCHVCLVSPVAPWALSYLLFTSRRLANSDICSKMKAWAKSECQYARHGQTKWTNGRVRVTVRQSSFKWKVTAWRCVLQKWPFLIRQQGTHLSGAQ